MESDASDVTHCITYLLFNSKFYPNSSSRALPSPYFPPSFLFFHLPLPYYVFFPTLLSYFNTNFTELSPVRLRHSLVKWHNVFLP